MELSYLSLQSTSWGLFESILSSLDLRNDSRSNLRGASRGCDVGVRVWWMELNRPLDFYKFNPNRHKSVRDLVIHT